jgi:hypothetical protein
MYSENHYRSRSNLAKEMSEMPENIRRKRAYIALSVNWKKLADMAAKATTLPSKHSI